MVRSAVLIHEGCSSHSNLYCTANETSLHLFDAQISCFMIIISPFVKKASQAWVYQPISVNVQLAGNKKGE